jgi:dTDP-4-dehydrorhamnose reductase
MKILVTGARGLVGGPLVKRLVAAGHEVAALDVVPPDVDRLDVTDAAACLEACERVRPERVVHLAAWVDVDDAEGKPDAAAALNVDGTRNVAQACRAVGASMLYVSTDYVFDGTKKSPYDEEDKENPCSVYGSTKLAGETHVRELAPSWWIVRCQSIYGDGGRKKRPFVESILEQAKTNPAALSVVCDQHVSPSWCEDVADALVATLLRSPPGLYHASNSGSCSWRDCAQAMVDLAGMKGVVVGAKTRAEHAAERAKRGLLTADRPENSVFDCSKLREATGHQPRPWRAALEEYMATRRQRSDG